MSRPIPPGTHGTPDHRYESKEAGRSSEARPQSSLSGLSSSGSITANLQRESTVSEPPSAFRQYNSSHSVAPPCHPPSLPPRSSHSHPSNDNVSIRSQDYSSGMEHAGHTALLSHQHGDTNRSARSSVHQEHGLSGDADPLAHRHLPSARLYYSDSENMRPRSVASESYTYSSKRGLHDEDTSNSSYYEYGNV